MRTAPPALQIMFVLVALSVVLCGAALIYLLARGENFKRALSFTIVLLVASIPIAIEIVCTTTLALGSRQLSVHGAIVTRLQAIEEMAGMNMLCSDKTGTLTMNKMVIQVRDGGRRAGGGAVGVVQGLGALAMPWGSALGLTCTFVFFFCRTTAPSSAPARTATLCWWQPRWPPSGRR